MRSARSPTSTARRRACSSGRGARRSQARGRRQRHEAEDALVRMPVASSMLARDHRCSPPPLRAALWASLRRSRFPLVAARVCASSSSGAPRPARPRRDRDARSIVVSASRKWSPRSRAMSRTAALERAVPCAQSRLREVVVVAELVAATTSTRSRSAACRCGPRASQYRPLRAVGGGEPFGPIPAGRFHR